MRKFALASASLALLSAQAAADVRPQDCRPVFPVADQVAPVAPEAVPVTVAPEAVAVPQRRYSALALLLPLLGLAGLIAIIASDRGCHCNTVSPA